MKILHRLSLPVLSFSMKINKFGASRTHLNVHPRRENATKAVQDGFTLWQHESSEVDDPDHASLLSSLLS